MMMKGYVTTLESISGKANSELEQTLGFSSGSLSAGFSVYALEGTVAKDEFDWRDRTRYAGGWHADPSIKFGSNPNTVWQVQRRDELRDALGKQHNDNEQATDQAIERILHVELEKLNVRTGPRMIVKVVPRQRLGDYPNSPYRNIPQWELKVLRPFRLL